MKIGDSKICRICKGGNDESFKYVGIHLDERLSFKQHVECLISKLQQNGGVINSAKKYLTTHTKILSYNAIIKPYIMYCSSIRGHSKEKCLKSKLSKYALGWEIGPGVCENSIIANP